MPDKRNGEIIYSYKPLPYAEDAIYRRIADITISMKSTDHLKMPELISTAYEVHLSESERDRYEDLKQEFILQLPDGEITAANAASLTGKLCQLANGAIYSDTGDIIEFHDRKLDALEDIIEAANEKPLLMAYWFRHDLSRIKKRFNVRELEMLSDLRKQIREVIEAVPDTDERMVLKYRYIHNYTWEQIGNELCADARTIRRWHGNALLHASLPKEPIEI